MSIGHGIMSTISALSLDFRARSSDNGDSWEFGIGGLDLAFDVAVSMGLLGFLTSASLIPWSWFAAYLLVWTLIFLRCGFAPPLAMLIQAPVYGGFMAIALRGNPFTGTLLLIWISLATALTWPKLPREIIPDFLRGMSAVRRS